MIKNAFKRGIMGQPNKSKFDQAFDLTLTLWINRIAGEVIEVHGREAKVQCASKADYYLTASVLRKRLYDVKLIRIAPVKAKTVSVRTNGESHALHHALQSGVVPRIRERQKCSVCGQLIGNCKFVE